MLKLTPLAAQISSNEYILPKFWVFFAAPMPCYSVRDSRLKNFLIKKRYSKRTLIQTIILITLSLSVNQDDVIR